MLEQQISLEVLVASQQRHGDESVFLRQCTVYFSVSFVFLLQAGDLESQSPRHLLSNSYTAISSNYHRRGRIPGWKLLNCYSLCLVTFPLILLFRTQFYGLDPTARLAVNVEESTEVLVDNLSLEYEANKSTGKLCSYGRDYTTLMLHLWLVSLWKWL